jgi:uncharacterized membrane protein YedE/YeeE
MSALLPLAGGPVADVAVPVAIGIVFGWFLERGGLGSARRIAGQFTLADFTVVKVMFSAILTAALGLFWLGELGVVDLSLVWIPETRPLAQALGGVLFGAGFAIAALCPGTSCVAAASGRTDGVAAILGLLAGTALFVAAYPLVAPIHDAPSRGPLTIPQALGVPTGAVLLALALLATGAFLLAERLERRAGGGTS